MNDNQVLQAIERFLTRRMYNYALMIDGSWGCGKTFFVKQVLIPKLKKNNYKTTYVSLYGTKDSSSISEMVYSRILSELAENKIPKNRRKIYQASSVIVKAAARWGLQKLEFGTEEDLEELLKLLPTINNRIIIFDDLERCNCPVCEVLGQINQFVEHTDAHVIIIANEHEIGNTEPASELQMLIAMNEHLEVDVPLTAKEEFLKNANRYKSPEWTPEYVERRRKQIFPNDNKEYKRIKEKLVGQTIKYEPDLKKIFTSVLAKAEISDALLEVCGAFIENIVDFAMRDQHPNIRTFLFFLEKSKTIFEVINDQYKPAHATIILYCYRSCIHYMKGGKPYIWDADAGQRQFGEPFSLTDSMDGFRFVDELIIKNHIEASSAKETVKRYADKAIAEGRLRGDPYQHIQDWQISEDKQVDEWLHEINDNILAGRYTTLIFPKIINYAASFEYRNMFIDISQSIISSMRTYIQAAETDTLRIPADEQYEPFGEEKTKYRQYIKEIVDLIKNRLEIAEQDSIESLLADENHIQWGEKLLETTQKDNYIHGHSFIYRIEPEQIEELIKTSDNKQIECFRRAIHNLYGNHIYYEKMTDDYDHLIALQKLLTNMNKESFGDIKKIQLDWLIQSISNQCELLHRKMEQSE